MSALRKVVPALLLLLTGACSKQEREAAPLVRHAGVHVSHEAPNGPDTSRVTFDWPRFTGGAPHVADSLTQAVEGFLFAGWGGERLFANDDSLARTFFDEQASVRRETGMSSAWFLERSVDVVGDTLGTLSLALAEFSYLGGAHPNSVVRLQIRDRRDGRRLSFADLFRENARDSLSAVCEPYFRTERELAFDALLDTAGFSFEGGRFRVNDNLALTGEGVRFRFDPYEIAPYALGPTEFVVPYAAVRSFARADGALARTGR